ncbi:phytanoyl-CoA dioxygenase family protein [Nitrincola alkalilacustris]|uniref:phytanoyl-CoA dioxygenase family protein n=1 Tax=Nitrincola alkalilacustris TaxID=1571224 RepID=UPI00124E54F7|nr:phytanoyl-CoA dioxygenase family protein [Nitrincola alkalilacustris]
MKNDYDQNGYLVLKNIFEERELQALRQVVDRFHQSWVEENAEFYAEKAINSAYLTAKKHLKGSDREVLFKFIGSAKLMDVVTSIMGSHTAFMNTQLFFDPVNAAQRSYWHRDPQYHLSVEEQKDALAGPDVLHFRVPLVDEPGLELIPGTHRRWDSSEELDVRLEQKGRKNHEDLPAGVRVALNAGDLLVFSANMIHRGLYGMNRLALDILFCDPAPELAAFITDNCLPDPRTLEMLENRTAFDSALEIKRRCADVEKLSISATSSLNS